MKTSVARFFVFFGIIWSAMTLLFDGLFLVPTVRQILAQQFLSTDGTILTCAVAEHQGGDEGTTYSVGVEYEYSVNERQYSGSRYRYDVMNSSDSAWAQAIVAAHPPGTKVPVFYDPANPQNSLLAPGLLGSDLFQLAFMTPFNEVMLGFIWVGWSRLRQTWLKPLAGGVKIINEPAKMRVRLTTFSIVAVMLATTALLDFISLFVVGFLAGGFHPPMRTMITTWSVIFAGGLGAGLWYARRIMSGKYDLVIDKLGSALELPLTQGRKVRRRVPFASVQSIRLETVTQSLRTDEQNVPTFAPTLMISGSEPHSECLVRWYDIEQARSFISWLNTQLPQKAPSSSPTEKP